MSQTPSGTDVETATETEGPRASSTSSGSPTTGSTTVETSTGDGSTSDESGGTGCEVAVEGPFLLSAEHFGRLSVLDLDGDEVPDLLGDRGQGLLGGFGRPTTLAVIDDPPTSPGFGGHFVSPTAPGAVYVGGRGPITVYADLDQAEPTTATISASVAVEVTDLDSDGLDDLAILTTSFDTVELWHADGLGGFAKLGDYDAGGGLPALGVAPATSSSPALILVGGFDVRGIGVDLRGGDELSLLFTAELVNTYTLAGVEPHDGERFTFLAATYFQQLTAYNRVGFSMLRDTGWAGRAIDLDGDEGVVLAPVATDLDGDNVLDAVIIVRKQDTTRVIGACSAGNTMERCFDVAIDLRVESLTLFPGPSAAPRWVLGTERAGLWGMEALGC